MVLGIVLLALPVFAVETIATNVVMPTFGTTQTVNVSSHIRLRKDVHVAPDNTTSSKVTAASANF